MDISVVVPTYERATLLERCLDALARQSMPTGSYEVIVADDAGQAATEAQAGRWNAHGLPVRYVAVAGRRHGPAAARNAGWRAASGWLVAFTDDDTAPDPGWLRRAHAAFLVRSDLEAAHGCVVVPLPPTPTDYERDVAGLEGAGFVTANCFVRRETLAALGGFDESFTAAWREDSDLFFRLLSSGRRVERVPDAIVVHPVRPAPWGTSVRQQRKSAFDALLYKKHRVLFARYVRPGRPILYYPIVLALLVACAAAAAGAARPAFGAAAAWVLLTGVFVARRLRDASRAPCHVAEMLLTSSVIPPVSLYWRLRGAVRHRVLFW